MSDSYEPTSLEEYLSTPVESSDDAAPAEDLQPSDDGLQADQSSEDGSEVASDAEPEQPESPDETQDEAAPADPPAKPENVWDSEDNPYRKAALELEQIKQFAQQKQAEQAAAQEREKLIEAGKRIMEVDESDIAPLMGDFIDEIRESAAQPYLAQINTLNHGMTALVAAIQTLPAAQQEVIKTAAAEFRNLGQTADDIERAFTVSQKERQAATQRETALQQQIRNLKAELAKTKIDASGKNRAEAVVVGAGGDEDPSSWRDLLGNGPL